MITPAPLGRVFSASGYSYFQGCALGPNIIWFTPELDLVLDEGSNLGGLTWEFGPSAPSGTEYDFESYCLRELGRMHLLGYANDPTSVMHYSFASGVSRRTLSANGLAGANFVQSKSVVANICGLGAMTPYSCNYAPTAIALNDNLADENAGVNAVVGTLSSTDPDGDVTFTYSLVAGSGDGDNASFNISGSNLQIAGCRQGFLE